MAADPLRLPASARSTRRNPVAFDSLVPLLGIFVLPIAATGTFAGQMFIWRQDLDGPHFLVGLLVFLLAGEASTSAPTSAASRSTLLANEFMRIALRWLLVVVVAWAGIELSGMSYRLNRDVLVGTAIGMPVVLWLAQLGVTQLLHGDRAASGAQRKAVIIGLTDIGLRWAESLDEDSALGVRVVAFFDDRAAERLPQVPSVTLAGKMAGVPDFVRQNGIRIVYITLPMSRHSRIVELLDALRDSTASIYFVPDVFAFNPVQARIECIHGIPLLAVCESPFRGHAALAKRAIDVFVSLSALAVFAVPMLLIAIAVRMTSDGPAIFKQRRCGLDGEDILVLKFRTMTVTEDGDRNYVQVQRGDARVTSIGAFLRATSLDELPQLINVIQGSMSIVGPRPHAVAVNEQYRQLIPSYMIRHKVKPGITGLAQVQGYRGGDDLNSMAKRIECDLAYLRNWSLDLDFRIMVKTAMVVWMDRNAF
jgi:putative colanic acid biosynthesis UDP-glucose lipid carrier transferase